MTCTVRSVEWREQKDARERYRGRQGERKRDLPPCLLISKGHPAFPLLLMQRFQGNGLMGKTTTAWLIMAHEPVQNKIGRLNMIPYLPILQ